MDNMRAPLDFSACVGDSSELVKNSLTDFWGANASNASFEEDFVANGLSIIERDEKSILAKNLPTNNVTLEGVENSDISWQISGDISLFRSDCSLRKGNRSIEESSIQGVPSDNTTFLRSMLARISEESETARSREGSGLAESSEDSFLSILSKGSQSSQGSGSSQIPPSYELKAVSEQIDLSVDWRSAGSFLKSQPEGKESEKHNFTAEFNAKDLSFLTKRPAGSSDWLTIFESNSSSPSSFCSKSEIDEESVLDLSNMSQVLRRLKKIPNDVSGTDIADMLVPPPAGVSTKARLAKHPEVTSAVPSMEEILKMMHDMHSASPATFVDGLLHRKDQSNTTKSSEETSSGKSTCRSVGDSWRDETSGPKISSSQRHKIQLKARKLDDHVPDRCSTSSAKRRQLSEEKSPKAWR